MDISTHTPAPTTAPPSYTSQCIVSTQGVNFMGIPKQIRAIFLKLLLHNEDLGKLTSVYADEDYGSRQIYGLTPAILAAYRRL